jgi:hypothetical protein
MKTEMQNPEESDDYEKKEFDASAMEQEIADILAEISQNPEDAQDLDSILAILLEQGIVFDISNLSALLAKFLGRMGQRSGSKSNIDKSKISNLLQTLQTESNFLLVQNALAVQGQEKKPMQEKDKNNLKEVLKKCIIYEAYKVVSPRAIAGETAESNFRNNIMMQGVDKALKIEKTTMEQAEKKYGKNFVKDLQQQRQSSSKGMGR